MSSTFLPLIQIKYIIELEYHVLSQKGFVLKERMNKHTIRIFSTYQYAEKYLNTHYPYIKEYTIKKIKITLEEQNE